MTVVTARASHGVGTVSAPAANGAGRIWVALYVGCVILVGSAFLVRFTPLTYPNPSLTIALLCSSLLLS
jgi:high-affinity Fe2+/Pb2+ permease